MNDAASFQLRNGALPNFPRLSLVATWWHQTHNFIRRLGQFAVVVKGRHDKRLPGSTVTWLWRCGPKTLFTPWAAKRARQSFIHQKEVTCSNPLGLSLDHPYQLQIHVQGWAKVHFPGSVNMW